MILVYEERVKKDFKERERERERGRERMGSAKQNLGEKGKSFFVFKVSIDTSITFWSIFFVFRSHGQMLKCITSHLETFYLFFEGNRL